MDFRTEYEGNKAAAKFPDGDATLRRPAATRPARFPSGRAMPKKDLLERYKLRISAAKKFRQTEGYDDLWKRLVDLYRGKHFPRSLSSEDRIAVNVAFSTVNVIYPSISVNYPKITVWATKPEDDDRAAILEAVVNYWWRNYKVKAEFRLAAKDFLILGHGWVKVGYRYREAEAPVEGDEAVEQFEKLIGEADEFASANPELAGDLPTDDEILASMPNTKQVILEDRPFAERVSPWDVYVDPEATSMSDLKWIAQRMVKPLEEVQKDPRYPKAARRRLKADSQLNPKYRDDDERKYGDDIKRVTLWEFYDVAADTMCVFTEGSDEFLVAPMEMPYGIGHPFVMLRNYDVPECFYPMGDLEALEPLQQELNKLRSQTMNHRKRFARKWLYREEAFNAAGRAALESEDDNTMVPVDDDRPFADLVAPMPVVPLPPDFYHQSDQIEADIDKVSGINEYQRGTLPEIRRTATEASIIQDAANSRVADKLAVVEASIADVACALVKLAQQFMTGEQVARVVGDNGFPIWVPYNRDDIVGDYDFEVEAGSTQPKNEAYRRKSALDLLNALAPFMDPQVGILNPVEVLKHVLQFGFEVKTPEKFLAAGPQQAPMLGAGPEMMGELPSGMDPSMMGGEEPPESPIQGVPPEILAQLQGQTGLNPMGLQ